MTNRFSKITAISAVAISLACGAAFAQDAYSDWDTDGEAGISSNEFNSTIGDTGLYSDWDSDGDGSLTESEFNDGLYGYYDDNGDGTVDEEEFGDLGDDMGDDGFFDI